MSKIQIDLSEEEDHIVELYQAENRLNNKREAIKGIIRDYKKAKR